MCIYVCRYGEETWSCCSPSQPPFSMASPTLAEYDPAALEKMRVAASRTEMPISSACREERVCY